ncbi:alpha-glucosidase [Faecalibacterium prausnitzii]|mgnify:FL=1|uniref:Alpha-glucosidase n=1 Tax=Faecalibacterium prausnitzii TaxID=853 RepID=A0A2A7BCX1_9FIRM|nr:TIM-barrel domain-containing protein [Faecalibacterium prausnitzii]MBS6771687.1 alpha-glucosidase [Faecalibacterium prausnitzii]MCC2121892.1 alpha-glucosidase [Faecalibacterium hominis (ex Afrizal et al. 2022)]PDX89168.1 alpha-glucosidase [Faecalibacterium prausnitzii]
MIQRFSFGHPFPTQSVVLSLPAESGPIPFLTPDGSGWQLTLSEQAAVYGLGEMPRGINKRGWHYIANNTDESRHSEDKLSFYGAHNFLLVRDGSTCFGLFVDFPGKVYYDIGYSRHDLLSFHTETPDYDLYLLSGGNENAICKEFRTLIGRSYIPPRWAFGLAQSRWGYKTEEDVREVARQYKEHDLPLDMICMDIEYMQDYADFTVNKERFPDLTKLSADLKAQGIRLVPIIDAGVRVDPNDSTCTEGLEKGYFCKKADGTPFVAAVWPGKAYFADFLRPEVREWFGHKYKALTDCGIEGFWNDMNEPSLFYSPERLRAFLDDMAALREKDNIEQEEFFPRVVGGAMGLMNSPADYASFYHEADGRKVRHDQVHNLYGGSMTRAAGEAFADLRPGQRTLLYSRSSFIGSHRYGGIWLGDNNSSWAQLLANIQMMPSVQMCGFLYSGADLCGFSCDTTPDLALRWLEFGLLTPLMRNHSAVGTRMQEYYRFPEVLPAVRNMIRLRYALLPYLYSEFMKAALENTSYFRPLAFDYPDDPDAREVEDQLLLGEGLMAAPVYVQNAHGRHVYLPEPMKLLRLRAVDDYDEEILPAGHHYIRCALDEMLLFIRPGHIIPVAQPANNTAELDDASLTLWSFLPNGESAEYRMYRDDGVTTEYEKKEHWKTLQIHHS